MSVVLGGVCPHPPIMVLEVGQGHEQEVRETRAAMLELAKRVNASRAEVLVMITPHGPVFRDGIGIYVLDSLKGDLSRFGAPGVTLEVKVDLPLASEIKTRALDFNVPVVAIDEEAGRRYDIEPGLDHGVIVPLYFLRQAGVDLPMVLATVGMLPPRRLYAFGAAVAQAAHRLDVKVAVLASGDLSHRLSPGAPAGYDKKGREFDELMINLLTKADARGIIDIDRELVNRAGECGLGPITMMLGVLDGYAVHSKVLSYEGPFGVGYLVAVLEPKEPDPGRNLLDELISGQRHKTKSRQTGEGYLVKLARATLQKHLRGEKGAYVPDDVPAEFGSGQAGVFVSLKKDGQLRGCIGSIYPHEANIIQEVITSAINAGTRDPRFYPVRPEELDDLNISVDVLTEPEEVNGPEALDPRKYGVIISSGSRSGVLLPNLEGINTVEDQLAVVRQKAGIDSDEPIVMYRFEVIRHT